MPAPSTSGTERHHGSCAHARRHRDPSRILGSVLEKDGKEVWNLSPGAMLRAILGLGGSVQRLTMNGDDPEQYDLGDGVTAKGLFQSLHLIPGLWKIDGIRGSEPPSRTDATPGQNPLEFAYDWRRDNRVSARKLARSTDTWLHEWRAHSGNSEEKLIRWPIRWEVWSPATFFRFSGAARSATPDVISQSFDKIVARLGLKPVRFHDMRHTRATSSFSLACHIMWCRCASATEAWLHPPAVRPRAPQQQADAADRLAERIYGPRRSRRNSADER